MKRFFAFSVVSATLVAVALSVPAQDPKEPMPPPAKGGPQDDMTVDPVCQMNIHKSTAPFFEDFQGERYYFCNQQCFKLFQEKRGFYAGAVQYLRDKTWLAKYFSRPAKLFAGEEMQFHVEIQPNSSEAKGKPTKVEQSECELIAELAGGRSTTSNPKLTFKALKEKGIFRSTCRFVAPGRLRLKVKVTFDDGNYDEVEFKLPVLPGEADDTGHEFDGKRMDMIIQHETMRKTGKYWTRAGMALEEGNLEEAKKNFALVKSYQRLIEHMVPHVFEDELDEFKAIDKEYAGALAEMEAVVNGKDAAKALESWKTVEALHCTECHMKFRWATFSDKGRYPVRNGK
ncbi:MAG: YHS domain-containing protein [Planctomycetota bacterium]